MEMRDNSRAPFDTYGDVPYTGAMANVRGGRGKQGRRSRPSGAGTSSDVLLPGDKVDRIISTLEGAYGSPRHGNHDDPLDELIFIKLSQQTNAAKFGKAYAELQSRFGGWDGLLQADEDAIADALRYIGLHRQRAHQLKAMLQCICLERGCLDLSWLAELPSDSAIAYLADLPGSPQTKLTKFRKQLFNLPMWKKWI